MNEGHPKHNTEEDHDDALSDIGMDSPHPDIRGLAMLAKVEFWQLFLTMALLSGLGLMTIKYVIPAFLKKKKKTLDLIANVSTAILATA